MNKASTFNVAQWMNKVLADGYSIDMQANGIVSITKYFTPGDTNAFVDCDMMAGGYLAELPQTQPGSTWGTDGGGIGGYSAIKNGCFRLNRSGISKIVMKKMMK